jgi:hypothetical protein
MSYTYLSPVSISAFASSSVLVVACDTAETRSITKNLGGRGRSVLVEISPNRILAVLSRKRRKRGLRGRRHHSLRNLDIATIAKDYGKTL